MLYGCISFYDNLGDFEFQLTDKLFSENPPTVPGMDLLALNTQRGRDHGIPGETYKEKLGTRADIYIYILFLYIFSKKTRAFTKKKCNHMET